MSFWNWGKSDTEKENLKLQIQKLSEEKAKLEKSFGTLKEAYENKFNEQKEALQKVLKIIKKSKKQTKILAENIEMLLEDKNALSFLFFSVTIQSGGTLELTRDSVEVAKKLQETHELFMDEVQDLNNGVTWKIRRKDIPIEVKGENNA